MTGTRDYMDVTPGKGMTLTMDVVYSADVGQTGRSQPLLFPHLTIGRSTDTNLSFPLDHFLSSEHAEVIQLDPGAWLIRDCKSRNGTFVNGIPVREKQLQLGDVVRVGNTVIVCHEEVSKEGSKGADASTLQGQSTSIYRVRKQISQVASNTLKVLILGETGTGKELVANEIHKRSGRKGAFVPINCGAIPRTLVESTFFGHKKGAFTGAGMDREGAFYQARGGTLFLDEVGELPMEVQAALLRSLDDGRIQPVGDTRSIQVDARVVAATNRDLEEAIDQGTFRADLYARLSEWPIQMPALRERREDITLLFQSLLGEEVAVDANFIEALVIYNWPRNIRELSNLAKRIRVGSVTEEPLSEKDLPESIQAVYQMRRLGEAGWSGERSDVPDSSGGDKEGDEGPRPPMSKEEIVDALKRYNGNVSKAASYLKIGRKTLYRRLVTFYIDPADFRS